MFCYKLLTFSWWFSFPHGSSGKESTRNVEDLWSIPGLGRSPGEGHDYPLQCPGLGMDCIAHGFAKSQTDWVTLTFSCGLSFICSASVEKNPPANAGDEGPIPGSGGFPGEGNSYPLQYSCLGNLMDGGVWWTRVHGIAKNQTQLSDETITAIYVCECV